MGLSSEVSSVVAHTAEQAISLDQRREHNDAALPYAGEVDPLSAYARHAEEGAVIVDVRTAEELKFIGYVPGSVHIAWQTGPAMLKNPRFLKELSAKVPRDAEVLFICRSGRRSADAAAAAAKAGYEHAYNILEGVEGRDGQQPEGWRDRGLPWARK